MCHIASSLVVDYRHNAEIALICGLWRFLLVIVGAKMPHLV